MRMHLLRIVAFQTTGNNVNQSKYGQRMLNVWQGPKYVTVQCQIYGLRC